MMPPLLLVALSLSLPLISGSTPPVSRPAPPGCGACEADLCAALPAEGCGAAGAVPDPCGCCSVCAAAEGERCGGRAATRRCGAGLECVRGGEKNKQGTRDGASGSKLSKLGTCVCKSDYPVCGSDAVNYESGCALKSASLKSEAAGNEPISVKNKGRCAAAPEIVSPPGQVWNVSGSQVYLSCEATGVPTPVLTWKKVVVGRRREELLPGDRDNLAVQTRGGPEKHEVTGWVLISPLSVSDVGQYECHATNAVGTAMARGEIHLVMSESEVTARKVLMAGEL